MTASKKSRYNFTTPNRKRLSSGRYKWENIPMILGISMIGWIIYLALNRKKIKATKYIPIVFLILFIVPIVMIQMSNPE